ncbi:MAG: hypothetical protein ACI9Z4_000661 [Polaribacter sp.]|jgi:hypothetical protein
MQSIFNKKSYNLLQINTEQEIIYADIDLKEMLVYKLNLKKHVQSILLNLLLN